MLHWPRTCGSLCLTVFYIKVQAFDQALPISAILGIYLKEPVGMTSITF